MDQFDEHEDFPDGRDRHTSDGKIIMLKGGHDEPGGGHMTHHAIWRLIDQDTQVFEMYSAHKGEKEMKNMEIVYQDRNRRLTTASEILPIHFLRLR